MSTSRAVLLSAALALVGAAQAQAPAAPPAAARSDAGAARTDAGAARTDAGADADEDAAPAGAAIVTPRSVVPSSEAPTFRIADGKGTATVLQDATTGATYASMTLLQLDAGAEVAEHHHEGAAELLYVQEGRAQMRIGGRTVTVNAGDAVYVPPGVPHSARVLARFRAVQVYSPGGAEQRFRTGARVAPGKK